METKQFLDELCEDYLSIRSGNRLKENGILVISELIKLRRIDLIRMENLGKKSLNEIVDLLHQRGLTLKGEIIQDSITVSNWFIENLIILSEDNRRLKYMLERELGQLWKEKKL